VALTCAAVDDVTAWCLLAFVVGIAQARPGSGALVAALTIGFILVMVTVVRSIGIRLAVRSGARPTAVPIAAIALTLGCCCRP
jgi:Kef-type K+ transport system membrane component KefB